MVSRAGLDPTEWACSDSEHHSTRVLCECKWFDGRCHSCMTEPPACMVPYEEDDDDG